MAWRHLWSCTLLGTTSTSWSSILYSLAPKEPCTELRGLQESGLDLRLPFAVFPLFFFPLFSVVFPPLGKLAVSDLRFPVIILILCVGLNVVNLFYNHLTIARDVLLRGRKVQFSLNVNRTIYLKKWRSDKAIIALTLVLWWPPMHIQMHRH